MIKNSKFLLGILGILLIVAVYFVLAPVEEQAPETNQTRSLFLKAVSLGKGQTNYHYSYSEDTSGYNVTYSLLKKDDGKRVGVCNPFSHKTVYWTENDTFICTDFKSDDDICSSIKDVSSSDPYLLSLESNFFHDEYIEKTISDVEFMESRGYLEYSPEIIEKTVNDRQCMEIEYYFDFTNLSVSDGVRLGLGATTPKKLDWRICVDNETGEVYEKYLNYTHNAREYYVHFVLTESDWDTGMELEVPENLTEGKDAYYAFYEEKEAEGNLLNCFSKEGEEKESCIASEALASGTIDVCELAGERRDRCFVSFIPIRRDESICQRIISGFFKDDCYTELAGWEKNSTYCDFVLNETKKEFCLSIAVPEEGEEDEEEEFFPEQNETESNQTMSGNQTGDVEDFIEGLTDGSSGNLTEPVPGNGS